MVTNMNYMFYSCKEIKNLNFTSFNTLKCKNFKEIFGECNEINISINKENNAQLISSSPSYIKFNYTV